MLKQSLACACLAVSALVPVAAFAGRVDNVKITAIDVRYNGYFVLTLDLPMGGGPACAAQYPNNIAGNANTDGGKAIFEAASQAYQNASRVYIQGLGNCEDLKVIESIFTIIVGAH